MKFVLLLLCLAFPFTSFAYQPTAVMHLGFGSYAIDAEDVTVTGSDMTVGMKVFYHENYAYFMGYSAGSAQGTWDSYDGATSYDVTQSHMDLSVGMEARFELLASPKIAPFAGGGLKVQQYEYKFDYPGSEIGESSGTGLGPLAHFGVRIGVTRNFTIIPKYYFSVINVKGQEESEGIVTSGTQVALVASF